jgi:hypothetical protein
MEFFFPDSQDQVYPYFDFDAEQLPKHRVRQRDDHYAHEILASVPYDGILVSKAMVDGTSRGAGKYSMAQSQRFYRLQVEQFFRLGERNGKPLLSMGDCGAFTYADEDEPPYAVSEVVDFYDALGFDRGVSMDHIVFGYLNDDKDGKPPPEPDPDWVRRRELTLSLAAEFFAETVRRGRPFEPIGAAHGWDRSSYQDSVVALQDIGFGRISLGGMVPLKTREVRQVVEAVGDVRKPETQIHLLGVTRVDHVHEFTRHGVTSFDSTSPLRQAFKDETDNYYWGETTYSALRVPQVDANPALKKRIAAGMIDQRTAITAERHCLEVLRAFDSGTSTIEDCVESLRQYELIYDGKKDRSDRYRRTLEAAPWKECTCGICDQVGIEVIIFRGSERNKRRGFHNLAIFRGTLDNRIAAGNPTTGLLK